MPGLGFGRKLSRTQRDTLEAMQTGATLSVKDGGSGLLHHKDGRSTYVAFQTWHSLIRRGSIAWYRTDEMLTPPSGALIGRITDAGRAELEADR